LGGSEWFDPASAQASSFCLQVSDFLEGCHHQRGLFYSVCFEHSESGARRSELNTNVSWNNIAKGSLMHWHPEGKCKSFAHHKNQ